MKWLLASGLALFVTLPATARETKIAVYDLAGMPMLEASATLRLKKVMGQIGTFALGQFVAGIKSTNPHHHFYNVDTGELTDIPLESVTLQVGTALPPGTEQAGIDVVVRVRSRSAG